MGKKPKNRANQVAIQKPPSSEKTKPAFTGCSALPEKEREHLAACTLDYQQHDGTDEDFCRRAVQILEENNALVIHNCMDSNGLAVLQETYQRLHQAQSGQTAIGEKDASKRSGTRLYNCLCQLGPACGFYDWKTGTKEARECLLKGRSNKANATSTNSSKAKKQQNNNYCYNPPPKAIWKRITDHFEFTHIARVEVVTSHVGCRAQGWHIDGVHGLTVIFPLVDVGVRQGPTEMDFTVPFIGLYRDSPKVKVPADHPNLYGVMPAGSVLMFNANVSHRGSANIGKIDRPILVLDCSLPTTCLAEGGSRDIWSV